MKLGQLVALLIDLEIEHGDAPVIADGQPVTGVSVEDAGVVIET